MPVMGTCIIHNSYFHSPSQEDGITINNCIYQCYGFSYSLLMVGLEYAYLLIIQVAAFILAIITRKVKIKALNDSKAVAIIVYVTSTILLFLGIFTFALGTRLILNEVLFSGGIMMCTTVLLSFVFIPKVSRSMSEVDHTPINYWPSSNSPPPSPPPPPPPPPVQ